MAAKDVASDPVPSQPEVPTPDTESIKPSSRLPSAVSSPVADEPPKVEWQVCPHCKSTVRAESKTTIEKASSSSSSSSPTTSDISQARSTSFARLGTKIREALSHTSESSTTTTTPAAAARLVHKKPQKKKPKRQVKTRVVTFDKGYEELGADHWADDY